MAEYATGPGGVRIAYDAVGTGMPVVLVHGFGASRIQNWKDPGWYQTLTGAGYRVIAMDCRGHGESDKPHDEAAYDHATMAGDVAAVIAAAGAAPACLLGYSMGGFIGMHVLMQRPELLVKFAMGGVGGSYFGRAFGSRDAIAEALLTPDKSSIADPVQRRFREFAEQGGKDRIALAACMRALRRPFTPEELHRSTRPVLVVCGENDDLTGDPGPLAEAFADGRAVVVPRRDHMTTVGDKVFKEAVLEFFGS
jgi:pimeloyl-ACP methyl ester carboxylesterase